MGTITKIQLPDGNKYNVKDASLTTSVNNYSVSANQQINNLNDISSITDTEFSEEIFKLDTRISYIFTDKFDPDDDPTVMEFADEYGYTVSEFQEALPDCISTSQMGCKRFTNLDRTIEYDGQIYCVFGQDSWERRSGGGYWTYDEYGFYYFYYLMPISVTFDYIETRSIKVNINARYNPFICAMNEDLDEVIYDNLEPDYLDLCVLCVV